MKWIELPPIDRDAALETIAKQYEIDTPSVAACNTLNRKKRRKDAFFLAVSRYELGHKRPIRGLTDLN